MCSPAPEVPSIEQAYSKHSDSITVEFTEVSGAGSYILRAETDDFLSETMVSGSPGTVVQLQPYTDYKLSVMSVNSGGRSQPSYPIQAGTGTDEKSHIRVLNTLHTVASAFQMGIEDSKTSLITFI